MSKRYLVTGGSGFIGSAVVKALLKDGNFVRVLDNNSRGSVRKLQDVLDRIEFIEGDIRDAEVVKNAALGMDSIIHLAYVNGTEFFYSKPELVLDVAVRGMISVLDACRANNIKELILASSSEVYQTPPTSPTDENVRLIVPDILNPRYSYGGGKIACELMAINYGRTGFDRVVIFRPHNVYGPDMGWEHVIPQFVIKADGIVNKTDEKIVEFPMQGDGSQTRAFVYIDDFVEGFMVMLKRGQHLNIYNIGNSNEEIAITDLAKKVLNYYGREIRELASEDLPAGGTMRRCPDMSKLSALGFESKVSLDDGLFKTVDWYAKNLDLRQKN